MGRGGVDVMRVFFGSERHDVKGSIMVAFGMDEFQAGRRGDEFLVERLDGVFPNVYFVGGD